jgi:hypothetical protein
MYMLIMQMHHQHIHIPQFPRLTALPPTKANLLALMPKPVLLVSRQRSSEGGSEMRRPGHGAIGVGGEVFIWVRREKRGFVGGGAVAVEVRVVGHAVAVGGGACLLAF